MPKKAKRPPPPKKPETGRGPARNRRKANKPVPPSDKPKFIERGPLRRVPVEDPGPEDVSAFDSSPAPEDVDQDDGG